MLICFFYTCAYVKKNCNHAPVTSKADLRLITLTKLHNTQSSRTAENAEMSTNRERALKCSASQILW